VGLTPISLILLGAKKRRQKVSQPKQRDVLIVLHELATLLESSVALIDAVESLGQSSHHPFITQTFTDIAAQLRQGIAFSAALQKCSLKLPWYMN